MLRGIRTSLHAEFRGTAVPNGAMIVSLFAVLDVETTGLSAAYGDRVVEIAVVILDQQFRVLRMFDSLVHPQRSIPSCATQIHGISDHDIRQAPTFGELLPDLMNCFAGTTHLVAHNISFDLGFLRAELSAFGVQMPRSFGHLCTMQLARRKQVAREAKLSTVAAALRIPTFADAHRAIVDAGITARVLSLLHDEDASATHNPIRWPSHLSASASARSLPRQNPSISLQSLTHFGLTIASNPTIHGADNGDRPEDFGLRQVQSTAAHIEPASPGDANGMGWSSQVFLVAEQPSMSGAMPIECTTFMHPQLYEYRTHQQKCQLHCVEQLRPLNQFLQDVHLRCPNNAFVSGPRASKMRYSLPVALMHATNHSRSHDAAAALEQYASRYRTAHTQVQCYMLENDSTTIAVEVPVWIKASESHLLPVAIPHDECLSGHIDLVSIEDQKIVIWDYKPGAAAEKFAIVQVALYAYMLSVRTGIPLDLFRCGYFDKSDCFLFIPALEAFAAMAEAERPIPSRPPLTVQQRTAQKPPDLRRLGIPLPHVGMNDTATWTWHLFTQMKLPVSAIASQRCMTESTVYSHLEQALRAGVINIQQVADSLVVERISSVWNELADEDRNLTNLNAAMNSEFPFGLLKCVTALLEATRQDSGIPQE